MVSSTVPRLEARWPPVLDTVEMISSLISEAREESSPIPNLLRSLGLLILSK